MTKPPFTTDIFTEVKADIIKALQHDYPGVPQDILEKVDVSPSRDLRHGDMSSNIALVAAQAVGQASRSISAALSKTIRGYEGYADAQPAGPGFVNITLEKTRLRRVLQSILEAGESYGDSTVGNHMPVNVEYVSANPDRSAACRPLPRRHRRRCAGQPARQGRLFGHQGILHQRRRRAGHRARLGSLLAISAGDRQQADRGAVQRTGSGRPAIWRRLPDPDRRRSSQPGMAPPWRCPISASPLRNSGSPPSAISPSMP